MIRLHLRELSSAMVEAWRSAFANVPDVEISRGDFFSTHVGPLPNNAPIDVRADAVVSPANSFGFMDGGIDALFTFALGPGVQQRVQAAIRADFDGELPVGCALIVSTGNADIPWCISAPTMRVPQAVRDTANAYLAFRAALLAVRRHNANGALEPIRSVMCPGLGTGIGLMAPERCARQMRAAWDEFVSGARFPTSIAAAARAHDLLVD